MYMEDVDVDSCAMSSIFGCRAQVAVALLVVDVGLVDDNGFAVAAIAVGCNCPIPDQLRWVDATHRPGSNPDVDVVFVVVVVDAATHANDVLAILIVDVLATLYPVDVVVYPVVAILLLSNFVM